MVGSGHIVITKSEAKTFEFGADPESASSNTIVSGSDASNKNKDENIIFVNIVPILIIFGSLILIIFAAFTIRAFLKNYNFSQRRRKNIIKKNKRYKSEFDDFDF